MNFEIITDSFTKREINFRDKFWGPKISKKAPSPNFFTIIRIIGSAFLFFYKLDISFFFIVVIILFLTDYFDGIIARTQNRETLFGKWADPIADRLLLVSVVYFLYSLNPVFWKPILLAIIIPEFLLIGTGIIHIIFSKKMFVPFAVIWGRLKFTFYFLAILSFLTGSYRIADILFCIGIIFAYTSVVCYTWTCNTWNNTWKLSSQVIELNNEENYFC